MDKRYTFVRLYCVMVGILTVTAITAIVIATEDPRSGGAIVGALMCGVCALLLPSGWDDGQPVMLAVGAAGFVGNLAMCIYFFSI